MSLPLSGARVVDAGGATTAYCAKVLWDLGADVVVLEPPQGHALRRRPPFDAQDPARSLVFDWFHSGSTACTVDPEDARALRAAAAGADVVLVAPGFAPWDADDDHPAWAPPEAVVCAITPFGRGGPYQARRATHLVSAAMSGRVHQDGPPDGPPVALPAQAHWDLAAAHGALAVLAALRARSWAGAQAIDISAQEVEATLEFWLERYSVAGASPTPRSSPVGIPPNGVWPCRDGVFEVSAYQQHHWQAFVRLLGDPAELQDPGLADMAVRRERAHELKPLIAKLLAPHDRLDLLARGQAAGLPCSVRNTPAQFVADEQLAARDAIVEREVRGRTMRLPASPLRANVRLARDASEEELPARAGVTVRAGGPGPLSDVRVLCLGAFVAGNFTASLLAGLGADVVKIEAATRPEVLRQPAYGFEARRSAEPSGVPVTPMFSTVARGMRNLALDVKTPAGLEVLRRLAAEADIVVENFGTGTMERQGMGFDVLSACNPRLVMVSLSGYGRTGPRAPYLAYAGNISNFCGLTHVQAHQLQYSDTVAAVHGAIGALAALDHAHRIGRAIHVDVAQIEAMASLLAPILLDPLVNGMDGGRCEGDGDSWLAGVFLCFGIDSWVAVEAPGAAEWDSLAMVVGRPDLAGAGEPDAEQRAALHEAVATWCSGLTRRSAAQLLQRAGVPAAPVQSVEDVAHDPQLHARGFPSRLVHPELGPVVYPGAVHRLAVTPPTLNQPARRLGADTRAVLRGWLQLDDDELDRLEGVGAIASFEEASGSAAQPG